MSTVQPRYRSVKTYGHERGLSCCFRQWRAESHCSKLHGYALAFEIVFESNELDVRNWVVDFGSMKTFEGWIKDTFDHTLIVARDDPEYDNLCMLGDMGLANITVVDKAGCEAFAELVYGCAEIWLKDAGYAPRVRVGRVKVMEHGSNAAEYEVPYDSQTT